MIANVAQLFVDDVKIIDQPFGCRRNRALQTDCLRDFAIGRQQHATILFHPGSEFTSPGGSLSNALFGSERFRVMLDTLDTENFSAYRLLELAKSGRHRCCRIKET